MPKTCSACDLKWPDAVNASGAGSAAGGTVGLNYCPHCGSDLG